MNSSIKINTVKIALHKTQGTEIFFREKEFRVKHIALHTNKNIYTHQN